MLSNLKIDSRSLVNLELSVEWQSQHASHKDIRVFEKFNVWRDLDLLPDIMQKNMFGKYVGYSQSFVFDKAVLLPEWNAKNLHSIAPEKFTRTLRHGISIEPYVGRYYPQGLVSGVDDVYSENMQPCRLIAMDANSMTFDFNHPLAGKTLNIGVQVHGVEVNSGEHGGRCNDVMADLFKGPGMQARHSQCVTDFFAGQALKRVDENPDSFFYSMPRMVNHLDRVALEQVQQLYASLIPKHARILDLMASINSHVPESVQPAHVTGLGMNEQELNANTALNERVVHDLNINPVLPFENASFDVVISTVSVEYLTRPFEVFKEIARILKPGGMFINVFSNRWFPIKSISVWGEMHEFERIGLVTEYYLNSGMYSDIHTFSLRGLSRPEDDAHSSKTGESDPVYAVWGRVK